MRDRILPGFGGVFCCSTDGQSACLRQTYTVLSEMYTGGGLGWFWGVRELDEGGREEGYRVALWYRLYGYLFDSLSLSPSYISLFLRYIYSSLLSFSWRLSLSLHLSLSFSGSNMQSEQGLLSQFCSEIVQAHCAGLSHAPGTGRVALQFKIQNLCFD